MSDQPAIVERVYRRTCWFRRDGVREGDPVFTEAQVERRVAMARENERWRWEQCVLRAKRLHEANYQRTKDARDAGAAAALAVLLRSMGCQADPFAVAQNAAAAERA